MRDMQRKHFKLHDCHSLTIDYNGLDIALFFYLSNSPVVG